MHFGTHCPSQLLVQSCQLEKSTGGPAAAAVTTHSQRCEESKTTSGSNGDGKAELKVMLCRPGNSPYWTSRLLFRGWNSCTACPSPDLCCRGDEHGIYAGLVG